MATIESYDFWRTAAKGFRDTDTQASCKERNPRIIKTIRLRRYMARDWLKNSDFKVTIHRVVKKVRLQLG